MEQNTGNNSTEILFGGDEDVFSFSDRWHSQPKKRMSLSCSHWNVFYEWFCRFKRFSYNDK